MAFSFTNKNVTVPTEFMTVPATHKELADQTADIAAQDLGVAGLKNLRGRMRVKVLVGTFALTVKVDTVVGMSSPETIFQSATYAAGVVPILLDFFGWSDDGFQFVNIDVTFGTSGTYDLILDAA